MGNPGGTRLLVGGQVTSNISVDFSLARDHWKIGRGSHPPSLARVCLHPLRVELGIGMTHTNLESTSKCMRYYTQERKAGMKLVGRFSWVSRRCTTLLVAEGRGLR